jgi:hypothetical protein
MQAVIAAPLRRIQTGSGWDGSSGRAGRLMEVHQLPQVCDELDRLASQTVKTGAESFVP